MPEQNCPMSRLFRVKQPPCLQRWSPPPPRSLAREVPNWPLPGKGLIVLGIVLYRWHLTLPPWQHLQGGDSQEWHQHDGGIGPEDDSWQPEWAQSRNQQAGRAEVGNRTDCPFTGLKNSRAISTPVSISKVSR